MSPMNHLRFKVWKTGIVIVRTAQVIETSFQLLRKSVVCKMALLCRIPFASNNDFMPPYSMAYREDVIVEGAWGIPNHHSWFQERNVKLNTRTSATSTKTIRPALVIDISSTADVLFVQKGSMSVETLDFSSQR